MKDPFTPARMAAVLALSATQQFYSLLEVANRVIPALSPLTCDPEKQVRDQAFKAIKGFMENLEKASENPDLIPEIEAHVKAGGRSLLSSDKVWTFHNGQVWALKSLSGKFYKGKIPQEINSSTTPESGEGSVTTTSATAIPTSENISRSDVDGWGDLEDNVADLDIDSADDWADALEPIKVDEPDEDCWTSGWESTKPSSTITASSKVPPKKISTGEKKPVGKLKLVTAKAKKANDDIDSLLGIVPDSSSTWSGTFNPSVQKSANVTSGWDDFGNGEVNDWKSDSASLAKSIGPTNLGGNDTATRRAEVPPPNRTRRKDVVVGKKVVSSSAKSSATEPKTLDGFEDW
ncbi:hypothetical protein KIN20_006716 [Parelaphostrongylus tenuis]|uniref:Uncharacterized protein n=1 Tax=Parelaphostrongylus tenuis TaxID=148309 RepID=A0AAD5M461_PARTN|nr:hypothetical protein KIN20_006716 [Parelaphostrongylus tenuis]